MPLSISEDEEVIHTIEVFLIIYHDLFCQRLWNNPMVIIDACMFLSYICYKLYFKGIVTIISWSAVDSDRIIIASLLGFHATALAVSVSKLGYRLGLW